MTATLRPVSKSGGRGTTQPSSNARLMIETSICLIVTASPSRISSTQAASHGAGHSLPVNSGKLLVACNWSIASRQRSRYTRSFQSGIRLPSGQPLWQNGTPHSMQRAACSRSSASGSVPTNSRMSPTRSAGARSGASSLVTFLNAPMRPISLPPPGVRRLWETESHDSSRDRVLGLAGDEADAAGGERQVEHRLVVVRHHLREAGRVPARDQARGDRGARAFDVLAEQLEHFRLVGGLERLQADALDVARGGVEVEHVGDAAAHAGGEVASRRADHHDAAAGHVLAAVVADALDDRRRA